MREDNDDTGMLDKAQAAFTSDAHERLSGEGINASGTEGDSKEGAQVGTTVRTPPGGSFTQRDGEGTQDRDMSGEGASSSRDRDLSRESTDEPVE